MINNPDDEVLDDVAEDAAVNDTAATTEPEPELTAIEKWLLETKKENETPIPLPVSGLPVIWKQNVDFISITGSTRTQMPQKVRKELLRLLRGREADYKPDFQTLKTYKQALQWFAKQAIAHPQLFSGNGTEDADNINIRRLKLNDLEWVFQQRSGLTAAENFR